LTFSERKREAATRLLQIQKKYFDGLEQRKNGRSNKYFCTWHYSTLYLKLYSVLNENMWLKNIYGWKNLLG
jgi:hypothetical protein